MTDEAIAATLLEIGSADLERLRAIWRGAYGAPPPLRSVELLRLMLAWRIQAEARGGFDKPTQRQLRRRGALEVEGLSLGPGTRLTRDFNGQPIAVVVEADGFRWEGRLFSSLSAAATAIAGTRWNGPRFFGLREVSR